MFACFWKWRMTARPAMLRISMMAGAVVLLLGAPVATAAGTTAPIRVERTVPGRIVGTPPRPMLAGTVDFADGRHGFVAVATGTCPGKRCTHALLATSDGGDTWQTVHTGITFSDLSFISPIQGFGVNAAGRLLETHDAGRHWSADSTFAPTASAVDFVDGHHGWLLAGQLYRTVDGGSRWTRLPFSCGRYLAIVRLSFVDARTGFLLCKHGGGPFSVSLYRSDDAGTSWRLVSTIGNVHDVGPFDFVSHQVGFVSAGFSNLLRTSDGGRSFRLVPGTPFDGVETASWLSPRAGYVVGYGLLMRTSDGGAHWRQLYPAIAPQGPISLTTSGAGVGAGTRWFPAAVVRTGNGRDWRFVRRFAATLVQQLVRTSPRSVWAVAPDQEGAHPHVQLFRSVDNGRSWRRTLSVPGAAGFLSFAGSRLGFLTTSSPFRFYVTRDGGAAWSRRAESVQIWNIQFVSATSGWAFGGNGELLHTADGGRHWQPVTVQVSGLRTANLYFLNPSDGWITGTRCSAGPPCLPVILRTRDGGAHWILIRFHDGAAFDGFDWITPRLGYVVNGSALYRTQDGGMIWRTVRG